MPELGSLALPALYVVTAALVVAVAITQRGAIPYFATISPLGTVLVLAVPLAAWALGNYQVVVFLHIIGALLFVGAHGVSLFVAFQLPAETEGSRVEGLLDLSGWSMVWMHAGLAVILLSGVAAGFLGGWWDRPWIWISIDLLLAVTAYMYVAASSRFLKVRHAFSDDGGPGWDEATRALVDRRTAIRLMGTGTAAIIAIAALMIFKP